MLVSRLFGLFLHLLRVGNSLVGNWFGIHGVGEFVTRLSAGAIKPAKSGADLAPIKLTETASEIEWRSARTQKERQGYDRAVEPSAN
jgi:hypothetical protein